MQLDAFQEAKISLYALLFLAPVVAMVVGDCARSRRKK